MVEPSITDDDRAAATARFKFGFVLFVGASGGLVSLQADPTLPQLAVVVAGSLVVGWLLMVYVVRMLRQFEPGRR